MVDSGCHVSRRRLLAVGAGILVTASAVLRPAEAGAVALSNVSGTINATVVTIHSGPSSSHSTVGRVRSGMTVACLATSGTWFKIRKSGTTGYIDSRFVTLKPRRQVITYTRGRTDRRLIALTFDAGADEGYAASILDTLKQKRVTASFGMTGGWARSSPELVARMAKEGHQLINHSQTHRSFTGASTNSAPLTPAQRLAELVRSDDLIEDAAGVRTGGWFRPPYGDYDDGVLRDISAVSFRYNAMWTVDSLGWNGLTRDQIVNRCLSQHGNGYIYLFHVGAAAQDGPALAAIIDGLRSRGYGFATVAQVVGVSSNPNPTSTPTKTRTATATRTPTRSATTTFTATRTPTGTATATASMTQTPTATATATVTAQPTQTLTEVPTEVIASADATPG